MIDRVAFRLFGENGIAIHWYGIIIAFGLVIGVILGVREARRRGYRLDLVLDFILIAIPLCVVCARLYYVIPEWENYANDILKIFAVWEGGLAIYGAVIGGIIAAVIFYRWRKVPIGEMMDIAAPGLILGQAIGRWGNFVNQEAFGNLVDVSQQWFPYSVYIEHPVINGVLQEPGYYQATFFYESLWNLITFAILMLFRKHMKVRGGVFALYLIFYGFGRFFIEQMRTDSLMAGDARVSQWFSAALVLFGIAYIIIMSKRNKEYPAYDGIYSLSWSDEQIAEYKNSGKKRKAAEKAEAITGDSDEEADLKPNADKKSEETEDKEASEQAGQAEKKTRSSKKAEDKKGEEE